MEKRFCRFCKEEMTYGIQREVMSRHVTTVHGKKIDKSVQYDQFGWSCRFKDLDNCDIVFDKEDDEKNKLKMKEAEEKLASLIEIEKNK